MKNIGIIMDINAQSGGKLQMAMSICGYLKKIRNYNFTYIVTYKDSKKIIESEKPNILVYGHSHILKVKYDKENKVLLINPGAAGRHGFHKKRTMVRFEINGNEIENMEVIELGNRSKSSNSIWGTNNF